MLTLPDALIVLVIIVLDEIDELLMTVLTVELPMEALLAVRDDNTPIQRLVVLPR